MAKKSGGGTKIGVEFGLQNAPFRQAMAEVSNDLRQATLDFKLLAAQGGDGWAKSMDGLTAKHEMLSSQLLDQGRKVELLAAQYEKIVAEQGVTSKAAMKLQAEWKQAQIAEANLANELRNTTEAMEAQKDAADGFDDAMKELSERAKQTNLDFKLLAAQGGNDWEKSADGLTAKSKLLTELVANQGKEIELLSEKHQKVAAKQGETSAEALKLLTALKQAKIEEANLKNQLDETNQAIDAQKNALSENEKATGGFEKATALLSKATGGASDSMVAAVATGNVWTLALEKAAEMAQKVAQEMIRMGEEIDDAYDGILIATGATGNELDSLGRSFSAVFASGSNAIGDVSFAIGEYNTRLGYAGEALESLSKKTLDLSRIANADLKSTIRETSSVVQAYGLNNKEAEGYLDALFVTSQKTGIGVDDLAKKVNANTAMMKNYGLGLTTQIALLGSFEKIGINAQEVMKGMTTQLGKLAESGVAPERAITTYTNAIKNAKTDQEALTYAVDFFGNKAGPKMAEAIRSGVIDINDLTQAITNSGAAIDRTAEETDGLQETLSKIGNLITSILGPGMNNLFDITNELIQPIVRMLQVVKWLADGFYRITEITSGPFRSLLELFNAIGEVTMSFLQPAIEGLFYILEKLLEPITWITEGIEWLTEKIYDFADGVKQVSGEVTTETNELAKTSQRATASMIKDAADAGKAMEDTYATVSKESKRAGESLEEYERRLNKAAKAAENHATMMRLAALQAETNMRIVSSYSYRNDGSLGFTFESQEAMRYYYQNIGKYASGTSYAQEGEAIVGENGPERVWLPRGSKVYTAPQSAAMQGSGGDTFIFNVNIDDIDDVQKLINTAENARRMARKK